MNLDDCIEPLFHALPQLSPREQIIVCYRFGLLTGNKKCTLASLGERFSVSRECIRQIEAAALKKLRQAILSELRTA
jgi:RNA polymerase primary sigma factor